VEALALGPAFGLDSNILPLLLAAFLAGGIDAVVGGGGLIQIPALFTVFPAQSPATLFGTNKLASVFGTSSAAWRYLQQVSVPWRTVLPAATAAFLFAFLGAMAVAWLPKESLRPLLLVLLVLAAIYTLRKPDFGNLHRPAHRGKHELVYALLLGALIGFYDGFFGPGTGSFLIFLFIRFFGFDFLHASASAKLVNIATNLAALAYFLPHGYWLPIVAVLMAICNVTGAQVGSRLALRYGNRFIRHVFLVTVLLLISRFAYDTLFGQT
jgi:uncharacterized membrane protein YfcA